MKVYQQSTFEKWPLDNCSVQAIITSPPYYNLRKYSIPDVIIGGDLNCIAESGICLKCGAFKGQYGNEHLPFGHEHSYLEHTLMWLKEAWRVLKDDGMIAIVIGDKISGSNMGRSKRGKTGQQQGIGGSRYDYTNIQNQLPKDTTFGVKRKSLLLIPERIMIGMQEMGFVIRNKIIYIRTMPESVKDRFSRSYEQIILASKNPKYYFNLEAVRETVKATTITRYTHNFPLLGEKQYIDSGFSYNSQRKRAERLAFLKDRKTKIREGDAELFGSPRARYHRNKSNRPPEETGILGGGGHYERGGINADNSIYKQKLAEGDESVLYKNPGSVWLDYWLEGHRELINTIGVDGYIEALKNQILSESDIFPSLTQNNNEKHYAPFSARLVKRLILATTRPDDIVLDPFAGSCTTVKVAEELGRIGIGIELGYKEIIEKVLKNMQIGIKI